MTQIPTAGALKRTPLYDLHRKAGAKMVPFGGWEMPVQYTGIVEEHRAVRGAVGLFDISHMGEFEIAGPEALAIVQQLTTKLSERPEVRFFVDDYNRTCRDLGSRSRGNINKTDYYARLRDHVGKLGRSIRSTAQGFRRDLGTTSKGYLKKEETELLEAYDKLATVIEKDERDLFHL